jgi:hypothetical protein
MNYSEEQLKTLFVQCRMPNDSMQLWENILSGCCLAYPRFMLGKVPIRSGDYIDLGRNTTLTQITEQIDYMLSKPFEMCKYCKGFDPVNSPRIPAAQQIGDADRYDMSIT